MSKADILYISDLDGTLLDSGAKVSDFSSSALNAMIGEGINFTIATGRTLATAKSILSTLKLQIPIVLLNGVLIYDIADHCYLEVNTLLLKTAESVIEILKKLNVTGFMYRMVGDELLTYHETLKTEPLRNFVKERKKRYNKHFTYINSFEELPLDDTVFFTLLDTHERLQLVSDAMMGVKI